MVLKDAPNIQIQGKSSYVISITTEGEGLQVTIIKSLIVIDIHVQ